MLFEKKKTPHTNKLKAFIQQGSLAVVSHVQWRVPTVTVVTL